MAFKPIQIVINAKDDASAVLNRLGRNVKLLGATIAGYFGVKAFAGVVQSAADFEAAMSRVKAATEGSAAEMAALTNAAQAAGSNTKYTSVQAAGALENLAKAGLNAGDAIKTLPAVLALAQAGDLELGTASEYVTKAVMGMGLAFDDAGRVADVLAKGANATNTSVEGLAQALSYAAPVANTLGVSLESTVAIIGKFADAGIDASRAGTALNSILSQFQNPLSAFRKELGAAGIVTTNFEEALHQLAAKGKEGEKAINAVGLEAGPALRALLNQGVDSLDALIGKLKDAGGSAEATAKIMSDNLNGSLQNLSSIWGTVMEVLNKPVLPVVRKGVDELTAAIRRGLDDGTIAKFGQTLATAFESGLKYFQAFAANVNFDAVILRLQVFASETGETLQRIGQYATNAGNIVKTAYGVMQVSGNALMTSLYGVATSITLSVQAVVKGLELLYRASSKVTFGGLSEQYKRIADDLKIQSDGIGAAADELAQRVRNSMGGVAAGAKTASDGFAGVVSSVSAVVPAADEGAAAIDRLSEEMRQQAELDYKATEAAEKKREAEVAAALATEKNKAAIAQLKAEYQQLIASGNLDAAGLKLEEIAKAQREVASTAGEASTSSAKAAKSIEATGNASSKAAKDVAAKAEADRIAAENLKQLKVEYEQLIAGGNMDAADRKLQEIAKAQSAAAGSAKDAAGSTALLEQAYRDLGMTTNKDLQDLAINARAAFERLEKDGTQPPLRIAEAWKVMAERVIAANGGIAPEWLKTQAAIKGYETAVDEAGKATIRSMAGAKSAVGGLSDAYHSAAGAVRGQADAMDRLLMQYTLSADYSERQIALLEREAAAAERAAEAKRKYWNVDKEGFTLNTNGQRATQTIQSKRSVFEQAKGAGLNEAKALDIADRFIDDLGQYTGWSNTSGKTWQETLQQAIDEELMKAARAKVSATSTASAQSSGPTPSTEPQKSRLLPAAEMNLTPTPQPPSPPPPAALQQVITHRHEVVIGGRQYNVGTDAAGSSEMQQLMAALERDAKLSGGVH